jgi:hypothetical protein
LLAFYLLLGGVDHLFLKVLLQFEVVVVLIQAGNRVDDLARLVIALFFWWVIPIVLVEELLELLVVLYITWIKP